MAQNNTVRPLLIHLLLAVVLVSISVALLVVFLQDNERFSQRLERIRKQTSQLQDIIDSREAALQSRVNIPSSLAGQFLAQGSMEIPAFVREVEKIIERNGLSVQSFKPSSDLFSLINSGESADLFKSDASQIQFRSRLSSFLDFLNELENVYPWIHIERLSYRVLSAESDYPIQCEILLSYYEIRFKDKDAEKSYYASITEDNAVHSVATVGYRELSSFYIPPRQIVSNPVLAPAQVELPGNNGPALSREWEFLGIATEGGKRQVSLKYLPNSAVLLFAEGESWHDWRLDSIEPNRVILTRNGQPYYIER